METVTIEKTIKFNHLIDSIDHVVVNDDLKYELLDDNTHAKGIIHISGSVNTIMGKQDFNEDVDVDIYAPGEKVIDTSSFKITIKDYSYMVSQQNLIIYLVLEFEGINDKVEEKIEEKNSEIDEINEINEINVETENLESEKKVENRNEEMKNSIEEETTNESEDVQVTNTEDVQATNTEAEKVKIIQEEPIQVDEHKTIILKENNTEEKMNQTWSTDLFKLNETYTTFMKIHLE